MEIRKVIQLIEESLTKNFTDAEIVRAPSGERELFGERG